MVSLHSSRNPKAMLIYLKSSISLIRISLYIWSWGICFVYATFPRCPWRPEDGVRFPNTGVIKKLWAAWTACWEQNLGPLEETLRKPSSLLMFLIFTISRQPGSLGAAWSWLSRSGWILLLLETGFHIVQASLKLCIKGSLWTLNPCLNSLNAGITGGMLGWNLSHAY